MPLVTCAIISARWRGDKRLRLSNVTCEAQREAVALAELIGGVVDSHTSL